MSSSGSEVIVNGSDNTLDSFNLNETQSRFVNISPTGDSTVLIVNSTENSGGLPALTPISPLTDMSVISPIAIDFKSAAKKYGLPKPETPKRKISEVEGARGAAQSTAAYEVVTPENPNLR